MRPLSLLVSYTSANQLTHYLQAPAKRSQRFSKHMVTLLGAACFDMLGNESRRSAHALV